MLNYFNRLINIKRFVRKLKSGKTVVVDPHSRRASMMRIKTALKDLRKRGNTINEGGYLFDTKTGKVSNYIQGEAERVDYNSILKTNPKKSIFEKRSTLHNHPRVSAPSQTDILNNKGRHAFIIDNAGNVYSFKKVSSGTSLELYFDQQIKDIFKASKQEDLKLKLLFDHGVTDKNEAAMYIQHFTNQYLHESELIRYRARFNSSYKRKIKSKKGQKIKETVYNYLDEN